MQTRGKIRWGILSTGNIAQAFAHGLTALPDAELLAVGSRAQATADRFGRQFNVPHRHAGYAALAHDPDVDVIYVATPHPFHKDNTLLCLEAGKAVLCEKPFTINAQEAEEVIAVARAKGLFLMEAMWMRFLPALVQVRQWIAAGAIGEVRMISADFGFRAPFDPQSRLFAPSLGGGALLDVGIYPLSLSYFVMGEAPIRVAAMAQLGETGVDEQSAVLLEYPGGRLAVLHAALRTQTPTEAVIMGTEGWIKLHTPMFRTERVTLAQHGQREQRLRSLPQGLKRWGRTLGLERIWYRLQRSGGQTLAFPFEGNGYNYEAAAVMRCLRAGQLECDVMPLDETLTIMRTLDQIRAQWGLIYPTERTDRA